MCDGNQDMMRYANNLFWKKGIKKYIKQLLRTQKHSKRDVVLTAYHFVNHFYIDDAFVKIVENTKEHPLRSPYFKHISSFIKRKKNDLV